MGASDFLNKVGKDDLENSKLDRENRMNPPNHAPGQSDDFFGDDFFNGESGASENAGGNFDSLNSSDPFGMGNSFGDAGGFGQQTPATTTPKSSEDKFFEVLGTAGKHSWSFTKEVTKSFAGLTPKFWSVWGSRTAMLGGGVGILGLVLVLFGMRFGFNLLIGGILTVATGILVLMLYVDKANGLEEQYTNPPQEPVDNSPSLDNFNESDMPNDNFDFNESSEFAEDEYEYVDDEEYPVDEDDANLFNMDDIDTEPQVVITEPLSVEEALESLPEINKGMLTRQYLYDSFTKVLPNVKPDYGTNKIINEDSEVFSALEFTVREAGKVLGLKEEDLPSLVSAEENLFTIKLKITRSTSKSASPEKLASEIATMYAFDSSNQTVNPLVYATASAVGNNCYITIFTGESALVTLKDMYANCKDFLLDSNNYLPIILGIDQSGKVILGDFKKIESVLITGMPRMGKSWLVQSVLTQMCAFVPPSELNFYIGDPKEGISDFKAFALPHVKKFVSNDDSIVAMLREVIKVEAPRRKKLIGDAGFVNIWDYKERYPDAKLPIIYILIDEVVTLAERMDKETKAEFQGYLVELISQLPAVGIRALLVPHVVKNDIIAKTATDLIQCRISVCGDASHVESSLGLKPKEFAYRLTNKGDIALKMPAVSPLPLFVHSPALTTSNEKNNTLFDYLRRLWSKLEPEEVADSVSVQAEERQFQADLIKSADDANTSDSVVSASTNNQGLYGLSSKDVADEDEDLVPFSFDDDN